VSGVQPPPTRLLLTAVAINAMPRSPASAPGTSARAAQQPGEVAIEIGECFKIAFRVAPWQTRSRFRIGTQGTACSAQQLASAIQVMDCECVGQLLTPVERRLLTIHAQAQAVQSTNFDLRGDQYAWRTVVEAQQNIAVVVEHATGNQRVEICADSRDASARDKLSEIEGMHADVANAPALARTLRVSAPHRLLVGARTLKGLGQPALRIFDHHFANRAQCAIGHQASRFTHQRIAGVSVRQTIRNLGFRGQLRELARLGQRSGHGFVAYHGKACGECRARCRQMHVIGRRNGHEIDAIGALRLGREHRVIRRVGARGVDTILGPRLDRLGGIGAEGASHQLNLAIELGRGSMHCPDKCARSATNHAHPEFSHFDYPTGARCALSIYSIYSTSVS
jgi:hypothetical protein